jgi:HD-GYP domain-containing protein (c-di-GMP phosphodiesterase class II)
VALGWIIHSGGPVLYWRTRNDIDLILASKIKEVWIDCSLGSDVVAEVPPKGGAEVTQEPPPPPPPSPPTTPVVERVARVRETKPVPASQEVERAALICQESKAAVVSMFEEVRMGKAVDVGGARQLVEDISDSISRNPGAIISLARLKTADDYTYMHSVAVCAMMVALAKQLRLDEVQTRSCGMAGLLHDLGKVAMPVEVLNKPGKLTDAEFDIMKQHPVEGHKMLLAGSGVDPDGDRCGAASS